jgi:hypothetical protein
MVAIAAALTASTACSGGADSPTSPTSVGASPVTVTVTPSPVTAEHCNPGCTAESGGSSYAFAVSMSVTVTESAGVSRNIKSMTLTGSAGTVTFAPLVFSSSDITDHAGSALINAHGSLSIPMRIVYNTPSGSSNLSMNVSIELDNGLTASSHVDVI